VEAFLAGRISFPAIPAVVEETLERVPAREAASIKEVLEIDQLSRSVARQIVQETEQNTYEERGQVSVRA
jgi:1-deoxy-D-xylulose 5-phosphate reductoisomerase